MIRARRTGARSFTSGSVTDLDSFLLPIVVFSTENSRRGMLLLLVLLLMEMDRGGLGVRMGMGMGGDEMA